MMTSWIAALDQALGDVAQQINALVPDETRDHGQNSYVTVLRQADALAGVQACLTIFPSRSVFAVIVLRDGLNLSRGQKPAYRCRW